MTTVAPYGGFMTKTLDEENARDEKLKQQQVEVTINNEVEVLRPEALTIRGVDNLSTEDIKAFIDYYLNFERVDPAEDENGLDYSAKPIDSQIQFRVQWINDTTVNIVFSTHEQCAQALSSISIENPREEPTAKPEEFTQEYVASIVQERETKPYAPTITFKKKQNLLTRLGQEETSVKDEIEKMDEDDSAVVLYTRQALQSDRKVKNASAYSRYYLLHGEPERRPRYNQRGRGRSNRGRERRNYRDREDREVDLFADRIKGQEEEEDLFADRLRQRSRSPTRDRSRSPMRMD